MKMVSEQKDEALKRLKLLEEKFNLNPNLVKYLEQDRVYYSYVVSGLFGCVDTIEYDSNYAKIYRDFEKKTGAFVYHAIETCSTMFGRMLSLLYIPEDKESWKETELCENYLQAYVYSIDEDFGEYGDIFLMSDNGALLRKK